MRESAQADDFTSALMSPEGVQLARVFRDADSHKKKLIVNLARQVVDSDK